MQSEQPVLYSALICERVFQDEDGTSTLFRVVDVFNYEIGNASMDPKTPSPQPSVMVYCALFTKWGGPAGDHVEKITLIEKDKREREFGPIAAFDLKGGHQFRQIRHNIRVRVQDSGIYAFRVYLDGQPVIDVPFQVNIKSNQKQP